MVAGVKNLTIVRVDEPLRSSITTVVVQISLKPCSSWRIGKQTLSVAEYIAADALARRDSVEIAKLWIPPQSFGFRLGDEIAGRPPLSNTDLLTSESDVPKVDDGGGSASVPSAGARQRHPTRWGATTGAGQV